MEIKILYIIVCSRANIFALNSSMQECSKTGKGQQKQLSLTPVRAHQAIANATAAEALHLNIMFIRNSRHK